VKPAAALFQKMMEKTFKPLLRVCVLIYPDDIVVYCKDMKSHVKALKQSVLIGKEGKTDFVQTKVQLFEREL